MHLQEWLRLYLALTLELPAARGAAMVASQRHQTSANLACFGIGLGGILHRDARDSKESEPGLGKFG